MSKIIEFPGAIRTEKKNKAENKPIKSTAETQKKRRQEAKINKYMDRMSYNVFDQLAYDFDAKDFKATNNIAYSTHEIIAQRIYYVLTELNPIDIDLAYDAANYILKTDVLPNKYIYYEILAKAYICDYFADLFLDFQESGQLNKQELHHAHEIIKLAQMMLFKKDVAIPNDIIDAVIPPYDHELIYSLLYVYGLAHFGYYAATLDVIEKTIKGELPTELCEEITNLIDTNQDEDSLLINLNKDKQNLIAHKKSYMDTIPKQSIDLDQFDWLEDEL